MRMLADLMDPAPRPWGLRGDPLLFDAMRAVFADHPVPDDAAKLQHLFVQTFETLTDVALQTAPDQIPVPALRRPNGGMSNGLVSRHYWQDRMLPTLLARRAQA